MRQLQALPTGGGIESLDCLYRQLDGERLAASALQALFDRKRLPLPGVGFRIDHVA